MDWNLKAPSWGFTESTHKSFPDIDEVGAGSSSLGTNEVKRDFSVDLKLEHVSNPLNIEQEAREWKVETLVSRRASSPLVSMKRPRGSNNGAQPVSCLVDGCYADLSNCRGYHRRHKVCELHSKTPGVTIAGHRQRFCQQCSRLHSLEEFDEGKRSCRKRLEGHNRRRQKPQPDPLIRPVKCLLNYQGSRLSPFPISNVYPSTALGRDPAWVRVNSPSNAEAALYNKIESHKQMPFLGMQSLLPVSVSPYGREAGKQFSLLQGHQTTPEASSVSQALHHRAIAISSEIRKSEGSGNMFRDGLLTLQVQDSDCALSLLSSSQTQTPRIGMVSSSSHHPDSSMIKVW